MLDRGIGEIREVRGVGVVHGDGIGNDASRIARVIRGDADALRAFDQEGGMPHKGEARLVVLQRHVLHARDILRDGEALAGPGGLRGGGRSQQEADANGQEYSCHGVTLHEQPRSRA
jgi:hypothetical protein